MNIDDLQKALGDQEQFAPDERAVLEDLAASTRPRPRRTGWVIGLVAAASVVAVIGVAAVLTRPSQPAPAEPGTPTMMSTPSHSVPGQSPEQATPPVHRATDGPGSAAKSGVSLSASRLLVASTDAWKAFGAKLIQDAKENHSVNMVHEDPFAVLSSPVDITGAGTYSLKFTMPANYNASPPPEGMASGFGLTFPTDMSAMFTMDTGGRSFSKSADGSITLTFQIRVSHLKAPYPGFTAWVSGGG